ncbi:hypothetical protein [Kitasatospora sp. NPDC091207]|uniref:hypothetical protein n=1 Tax=Kitasatospora sp. NPDC091207 TaxID=3364083 RepID=UPI00381471D8
MGERLLDASVLGGAHERGQAGRVGEPGTVQAAAAPGRDGQPPGVAVGDDPTVEPGFNRSTSRSAGMKSTASN